MDKIKLGIFLSGSGSNAVNICRYFRNHEYIEVSLVVTTNDASSGYHELKLAGYQCILLDKEKSSSGIFLKELCLSSGISYVILAGYLRLVPKEMVQAYRGRIINIHPSLLPAFGGSGMYGDRVHRAVLAAGEPLSGISIHFVDEHFDTGRLIAQFYCEIDPNDGLHELKDKITKLEHSYFPVVIEQTIWHRIS